MINKKISLFKTLNMIKKDGIENSKLYGIL